MRAEAKAGCLVIKLFGSQKTASVRRLEEQHHLLAGTQRRAVKLGIRGQQPGMFFTGAVQRQHLLDGPRQRRNRAAAIPLKREVQLRSCSAPPLKVCRVVSSPPIRGSLGVSATSRRPSARRQLQTHQHADQVVGGSARRATVVARVKSL